MPNPIIQNTKVPRQKSITFFITIFPEFFALVSPAYTIVNPGCIKNTSTAPKSTQIVSTDENMSNHLHKILVVYLYQRIVIPEEQKWLRHILSYETFVDIPEISRTIFPT